jgi:CRP-like cAMP-binding protein
MLTFFHFLNSLHPLSAAATSAIMQVIQEKALRKGQVWLQEGAVCNKLCFVSHGLLKMYFEMGNKELILRFASTGNILFPIYSFFNQTGSPFIIKATEPTSVKFIYKVEWDNLRKNYAEVNIIHLKLLEQLGAEMEQRIRLLLLQPHERYCEVMRQNEFSSSDKDLAAFLGVGPDTFSRWKNQL